MGSIDLCGRCSVLTVDELNDNDILFHPDLLSLKTSALAGCRFCTLCWNAVKHKNKTNAETLIKGESLWDPGQRWDPAMWLRGHNFQNGSRDSARIEVSCGRSKPHPDANPLPGVVSFLTVAENSDVLSKYKLFGRYYGNLDQGPQLYLSFVRQWLKHCLSKHDQCRPQADQSSVMPTRVIDVGDPDNGLNPRLVLTSGLGESKPYIALSYCWGVVASEILTLNSTTYSSLFSSIDEPKLARTYRDLLSFARALEIQYVWADALCIIQGDAQDWERESQTMADVYKNAILTVVAGRSADVRIGFIKNDLGEQSAECSLTCWLPVSHPTDPCRLMLSMERSREIGPVSSRAWCLQERLCARRSVTFGSQQLFLSCMTGIHWEDGRFSELGKNQAVGLLTAATESRAIGQKVLDKALQQWYRSIVRPFSQCRLSNPHDVFAALSAVAQQVAPVLGQSRYLCGLWECDILRGLLWKPCFHLESGSHTKIPVTRPLRTSLTPGSGPVVRAPSWSWASVSGAIDADNFSPPMVKRWNDPSYSIAQPQHVVGGQRSWSLDTKCGVRTMLMPSCQLDMTAPVSEVVIVQGPTPKGFGYGLSPSHIHGRLVVDKVELERNAGGVAQPVAVGFFDIAEESRVLVEGKLWAILLVRDRGLLCVVDSDKPRRYARVGWFKICDDRWLLGNESKSISLV